MEMRFSKSGVSVGERRGAGDPGGPGDADAAGTEPAGGELTSLLFQIALGTEPHGDLGEA